MFILVTGGSGSGKSAYAEECACAAGCRHMYYIAAMICHDDESRERVRRHREARSGKGFVTIERYTDLAGLRLPDSNEGVCVLLECMSNLTANEMFDKNGSGDGAEEAVKAGIDSLLKQCDNLVVVTNEIFSDGILYDSDTEKYRQVLAGINSYLASLADRVVEVVFGIPVILKDRQR
ncbi:MAG: bifunctional adenosylcobinamide kinase/adenosylcobinamide-phosphate guanylyltransferase [Lachnospiraceae bacterium]|nr:bifunctional adenosylcobinamide kinase/adenosylcobinamide-phosphate guanylyltransferase [Lachnospiraceae bacterium]